MKLYAVFFLFCLSNAYSSEPKTPIRTDLSDQQGLFIGRFEHSVHEIEPLAGSQVTMAISLELDVDLGIGSSIAFSPNWLNHLELQRSEPEGANYLEHERGEQSVSFVQKEVILNRNVDTHVTNFVPAYDVHFEPIKAGTVLRFLIRNVFLPKLAPQEFVVRPFVRLSEGGAFYAVPGSGIEVVAGKLSKLRLITDSIVGPGDDIKLRVRMEDQYGNLASDQKLSLDLLVNGQFRDRVSLSNAYTQIPNVRMDLPGVYELEVRTGGGGLRAVSNPVLISPTDRNVAWLSVGKHAVDSGGVQSHADISRSHLGVYDETLTIDHGATLADPQHEVVGSYNARKGIFFEDRRGKLVGLGLAEGPSDIRYFDPDSLNLVQIAGPASDYIWFGNVAATRGYRVGFIAFDHSNQFPGVADHIYTGLVNKRGDEWFHSLAAGRTFVSVGEKILLLVRNYNLPFNEPRQLTVQVVAANPIARVELYKNGVDFERRETNVIKESTYTLKFKSSNKPLSGIESKPRNRREWIGFLATRDAGIKPVSPRRHWLLRPAGVNRFDFLTWLHGGSRQLDFKLNDATPDTVLEIGLAGIIEDAAWLPIDRPPQSIAPQKFLVPLSELEQGAVREFEAAGYLDRIEVKPSVEPGEKSLNHIFVDTSQPRVGDYYYIKAVLANGAYAYSSPIFVEE